MNETCRLRRGEGYEACPDEAGTFLGGPGGPIFSRKEAPREEKRKSEVAAQLQGSKNGNRVMCSESFFGCPPMGPKPLFSFEKENKRFWTPKKENCPDPLEIPLVSGGSLKSDPCSLLRRCR